MIGTAHAEPLDKHLLSQLAAIVGERNVLTDPDAQWPFQTQPSRYIFDAKSKAVVRPQSTQEVCSIARIAYDASIPMVPQGGNTGLVGGQIPVCGEIVLSLQRMNRIREIDTTTNLITCEAGVILRQVLMPLS